MTSFWRLRRNRCAPGKQADYLNSIRVFLHKIKVLSPRGSGNGWKITKFHEMLHLCWYISFFGAPQNFDSGRCEYNHRQHCKRPAITAQKRHGPFVLQVGMRLTSMMAVDKASIQWKLDDCRMQTDNNNGFSTQHQVTKFQVELVGDGEEPTCNFHGVGSGRFVPQDGVASFVVNRFLDDDPGIVTCQTEHKQNGVIYRAHPDYRSTGKWEDWAWVSSIEDGVTVAYPARIIGFVLDADEEMQAIVHMSDEPDVDMESVITLSWKMENENDRVTPVLRAVGVTNLEGVCFCIQNTYSHALEIRDSALWAEEF